MTGLQVSSTGLPVLGIDLGGTGSRAALAGGPLTGRRGADDGRTADDGRIEFTGAALRVSPAGSDVVDLAEALIVEARRRAADAPPAAVGIGASGAASLVDDPAAAARRLALAAGAPVVFAADVVTAHAGALGGRAGAVVAVGTGSIALGTDHVDVWRRVGGWGHLYDDRGSGSWIGLAALRAAIETHDGIRDDAHALLDAAVARFGPAPGWPAALYPRPDRAGVAAGLARDVAALADDGDPVARSILDEAGRLVAGSLAAALDPSLPALASYTGGLFASPRFTEAFRTEFAGLAPDAELVAPAGDPLDGAVHLARRLANPVGAAMSTLPGFRWLAG
ncbi:N-acetylglucosamine kinase [Agromyces sp. LHK192]|uniref:N-acetylglucosamine kinase n=1 Tax=Agromyces sp. LHK192 TaxID=2498704 RepID=UPI000FDB866F|nr:BadF/BadG/BcrA/BcrD ATPase family protein [Agromyces sp. LHK192]